MKIARMAALALLIASGPALAQEKSATRPGFAFPTDKPIRILVFRPSVKVGSQSAGGVVSPNAEWTGDARKFLAEALIAAKPGGAANVVFMPELQGDDAAVLADYRALFDAVANTVLQHRLFKGDRLPTKKTGFEYSLGSGIAKLGAIGGGDYGVFISTNDAFGSTGRKLLQAFSLMTGSGIAATSGKHTGFAGLVDLKTGELIWMNADYEMGGDVRTADGAVKRVGQLMEDFPAQAGGTQTASK